MLCKYQLIIAISCLLASCNNNGSTSRVKEDTAQEVDYPKHNYHPGELLADHNVKDLNQNTIPLFTENKINLVVFWASWCPPCRAEIPQLRNIYQEISDRKEIHMISVSLDDGQKEWRKALNDLNLPWPQAIAEGELDLVEAKYGFPGIPYMIITDKNKKLVKSLLGFDKNNEDTLRRTLASLQQGL